MVSGSPLLERSGARANGWLGDSLRLETLELTMAYWATALLFSLAFWVTPFPPLIDYPQHVAVGALLHRMLIRRHPSERSTTSICHVQRWLSRAHRGALVSGASRDRRQAAHLGLPARLCLRALALVAWPRGLAGTRSRAAHHLQLRGRVGVCQLLHERALRAHQFSSGGARTSGEKGLLWKVMLASLSRVHARARHALPLRDDRRRRARGVSIARVVLFEARLARCSASSLSPSGRRWCGRSIVFMHNRYSPHANWEGWDDGLDDPLWYKLLHATAYAVGNFRDHSDQLLLDHRDRAVDLPRQWPRGKTEAEPQMKVLAITWAALYCVVPNVFIATWFIFERFPTFVLGLCGGGCTGRLESSRASAGYDPRPPWWRCFRGSIRSGTSTPSPTKPMPTRSSTTSRRASGSSR